jgi:hypothetical protein
VRYVGLLARKNDAAELTICNAVLVLMPLILLRPPNFKFMLDFGVGRQ